MEKLTKKEEVAMRVLWRARKGFVKDLQEMYPGEKPHYNTLSSLIRGLEEKGYVSHKSYGKNHEYFPLITKEEYQRSFLSNLVNNYFDNSYKQVVSFFAKEQKINIDELKEIINMIENNEK